MTDLSVGVGIRIEVNTDEASVWRVTSCRLSPPGEIAAALHNLVTLGVLVVSDGGWQLVDRYEIT